jgi:general L-amino acid transport system substrate-binding protein
LDALRKLGIRERFNDASGAEALRITAAFIYGLKPVHPSRRVVFGFLSDLKPVPFSRRDFAVFANALKPVHLSEDKSSARCKTVRCLKARATALAALLLVSCVTAHGADQESTRLRVQAAGVLQCAADGAEAEYSTTDDHGNRADFDADLCQAVAAAVGVKAVTTSYPDDAAAIAALRAEHADLIPTLTDDFTHATANRLVFTRPVLWDGVGFLVPGGSAVTRARQLGGKKVCYLAETVVEETVRAWFARAHLQFVPFPFSEEGEMQAAFATGNCAALAGQRTRLAQTRATLAEHGSQARLLADVISNDPLAAAVRDDDPAWPVLVGWVIEALVAAEQSGITQANIHRLRANVATEQDPARRFLLGGSKQVGAALGLDDGWVARMIQVTGNYGEMYERDLGSRSAIKLARGLNRLSRDGGLLSPLPPR